jgi:RNA polymerase sigma-70 factor (ECF subfamily)
MASIAIDDRLPDPHEQASRLYEAHSEWLLRYCLRQLRDYADAEDAVQIVFLYAFRALRRGVVPECDRAWLTTIARNVCHEQRRTSSRRPETSDVELDRIALARPDHEEVGFLDEVRAALAAMPENQRRALLLREWQGLPSSEIANQLELSEPATHALLFRARRSFANAIEASRRSVAGLNVAAALQQLRAWLAPLLEGAPVKAAAVTTAAGVIVGGAVLEQRIDSEKTRPSVRQAPSAAVTPRPRSAVVPAAVVPNVRARAGASGADQSPARASAPRPVRTSAPQPVASPDDTIDRYSRPPKPTEPPAEPPVAGLPGTPEPSPVPPAPPVSVPPVEPPPLPVDLPPILGEDPLPPSELPPPLDELLPPVELPPVEPPPLPPLLP